MLTAIEGELMELGELAGGELYQLQIADRLNEPVHTPWDAWGNRIDRIEVSPLWKKAEDLHSRCGHCAQRYSEPYDHAAHTHRDNPYAQLGPARLDL